MENIPINERQTAVASFGRVGVIQPNKMKNQMAICQQCHIVIPVSEYEMWRHWKLNCVRPMSFKYVYPTDPTDKTKVECLICQNKFDNIALDFMKEHQYHCFKKQCLTSVHGPRAYRPPKTTTTKNVAPSSQVISNDEQPANNYTISPISPIDLNQLEFDKFGFALGANKFHYGTQCRLCKEVFVMDTMKLLQHRTQCKIETPQPSSEANDSNSDSEVLIAVQTVHTPVANTQKVGQSLLITNARDNSTAAAAATPTSATASPKFCFVCNAASNDSFIKMFGTNSTHSKKQIYDFIWKFLDNKPSVRHATADASSLNDEVLCSECYRMICSYDAARSRAKHLKKQIRQKLAKTETYFEQTQNRMDTMQTAMNGDDGNQQQHQQQKQEQQPSDYDMTTKECEVIDLCDDD